MKTINFELSKRLNDLGLLDNIETECSFLKQNGNPYFVENYEGESKEVIKALTLEEAIEFLPNIKDYDLELGKREVSYRTLDKEIIINEGGSNVQYYNLKTLKHCNGKTLLEAVEKMLEYLLDNNLLGQENN